MSQTTIDLDIPHDSAERVAREDAYNRRFRERIVEVLRKYGITLDDAPLSALAMAMARMNASAPAIRSAPHPTQAEEIARLQREITERYGRLAELVLGDPRQRNGS